MELKITRINKVNLDNKVRAFVDVEYDGLHIGGFRIIDTGVNNELWVGMPREKGKDGKFYDICHFADVRRKREFTKEIIDEYKKI